MYDMIRAWKDEDYRAEAGLTLDDHPAGQIDLSPIIEATYLKTTPTGTECPTHARSCTDPSCTNYPPSECYICTTLLCYDSIETLDWMPELIDA